jgi:hypothetical protein
MAFDGDKITKQRRGLLRVVFELLSSGVRRE